MFEPNVDYVGGVLDEIALEGLDGITLQGLWLRLSHRPKFPIAVDDKSKLFLWKLVTSLKDVEIYELPEPRKPLVIFNRYDYVDQELGMILEPDEIPEEIYPHCPIDDKENNIRGSSLTYATRKNVTLTARKLSLEEAEKQWDAKLVLVASQSARNVALMGKYTNPLLELTIIQYCMLERIGRSRYLGEVTQGKMSLQAVGEEPKALFYHRKYLKKHKLIMKQVHHQKAGTQNCSGSLIHLPRFYVERKPKALFLTQKVIQILKSRPNNLAEYEEIRQELGLVHSLKKLFKTFNFQQYVRTDMRLPYRSIYPNASVTEWKHKGNDKEKIIRAVQLINPNVDERDVWTKHDDVEEDDDDDEDPNEAGLLNTSHYLIDRPMLSQVFNLLDSAGPHGFSQQELARKMGLSKLDARTMFRNLLRKGIAFTYMIDVGRQRVARIVSKRYEKDNALSLQFAREKNKMLALVADSSGFSKKRDLSPSTRKVSLRKKQKLDVSFETVVDSECSDSKDTVFSAEDSAQNNQDFAQGTVPQILNPQLSSNDDTRYQAMMTPDVYILPDFHFSEDSVVESQNIESEDQNLVPDVREPLVCIEEPPEASTRSFIEDLKNIDSKQEAANISYRMLKRANLIMETVKFHKVIYDLSKLLRMINDDEEREGIKIKMDKKSLLRILLKLCVDGHIKIFKIYLKGDSKEKMLSFVCDPSIDSSHTVIQSAIEQAKLKFFIPPKERIGRFEDSNRLRDSLTKDPHFETPSVHKSMTELKSVTTAFKKEKLKLQYDHRVGKTYGFSPKFVRMQIFHHFLFYIIYDYEGKVDLDQDEAVKKLIKSRHSVDDKLREEMSHIFYPNVHWKMFIPPLPVHTGWPDGWTIMCDVLLRLPLSIFVKIFNVTYIIPGLKEYYLDHPIRQHFLVRHLPLEIRNVLMIARKYIFSIHEVALRLCYIGLVQFGPHRLKEKDQVFLFLNRKATLMDTTTSRPGYHQISDDIDYPIQKYEFSTSDDVERYWYNMWDICIHTPLGGRMCVTGKDILLEVLEHKQSMIEAVQPRRAEEACERDDASVPGDRKGAAGLDSALFSHLKRNWNWHAVGTTNTSSNQSSGDPVVVRKIREKIRTVRLASLKNDPVQFEIFPNVAAAESSNGTYTGFLKKRVKVTKKVQSKEIGAADSSQLRFVSRSKKKHIIRHVLPRKCGNKPRRPYYDEIDKGALQKMNKQRVDWSSEEDSLLLLCKVASMYLCPTPRKVMIAFNMTRDILHKFIPASENKTSRACQRRILYMLKNSGTAHSVALKLEEISRDPDVIAQFENAVANIRTEGTEEEMDAKVFEKYLSLVKLLKQKTNKGNEHVKRQGFILPDTVEEFREKFDVVIPKSKFKTRGRYHEVKNVVDIHCAVVNSVIHSSLCTMGEKVSYTYQLFQVYRQYPDNLLRSAIAKFRADRMISLKKPYAHKKFRASHYLPVSSIPYQLSINYSYVLQTKYHFTVFREAHDMLKKLVSWSAEQGSNTENLRGMEFPLVEGGGTTALFIELFCQKMIDFDLEIPENMIVLDPRIAKVDEQLANIIQECEDISTSKLQKFGESLEKLGLPYEDKSTAVGEKLVPEYNIDSDSDEEDGGLTTPEGIPANLQTCATRNASRLALYIKRGNPQDVGGMEITHAHDFFVVNSCEMYCKLKKEFDGDSIRKSFSTDTMDNCIKKLTGNIIVPDVEVSFSEVEDKLHKMKASKKDVNTVKSLVSFVENKKEIGATMKELRINFFHLFEKLSLVSILQILMSCRVFLRSGVTTITYVHYYYRKPWLISSFKMLPDSMQVIKRKENVVQNNDNRDKNDDDVEICKHSEGSVIKSVEESDKISKTRDKNDDVAICKHPEGSVIKTVEESDEISKTSDKNDDIAIRKHPEGSVIKTVEDSDEISKTSHLEKKDKEQSEHEETCKTSETEEGESSEMIETNKASDKTSAENKAKCQKTEKFLRMIKSIKECYPEVTTNLPPEPKKPSRDYSTLNYDFSSAEKIKVAIRPWVRVDGTLNRSVLDRLLGSLLGHSLCNPGYTIAKFYERFSPALQPFHVRELIEILQEIGCVNLYVIRTSWKTTLFSAPSTVTKARANGTEDESEIIVEPVMDAIVRLSLFIGKRTYPRDFLVP